MDGDDDYDLLIGAQNGITYAYENIGSNANPVWTVKSEWNAPDIGSYAGPCLADLDGDGDYDLLIGGNGGVAYGFENIGTVNSPVWTAKSEWNSPDVGNYAVPSSADLDGDGDYDLLIGAYSGVAYGFENIGTVNSPVWTAKSEWNSPDVGSFSSSALADLDGDGDYDLVMGPYGAQSHCLSYENTGNVNSPVWTRNALWDPQGVGYHERSGLAGLDGDGDCDLLLSLSIEYHGMINSGGVYGYENTASTGNPDLTPSTIDMPASINIDTPCTITATINNTGSVDVGAFVATLSVDGTVVDTQSILGPAAVVFTVNSLDPTPWRPHVYCDCGSENGIDDQMRLTISECGCYC